MKHLILCREYPPAPSGGIGTYADHISRLLAEQGETVHVIGQMWKGAERPVEERMGGRLIVHRVPLEDWRPPPGFRPSPALQSATVRDLFASPLHAQCFSWQAAHLAEKLVEGEGIDTIEAQEYEAPLYFFQLRRALGWGPSKHPPCIVHLHSPTEFIALWNDWDLSLPDLRLGKRLEDYTITAADALLCPSAYLARMAEDHYGLAEGAIQVIPHPIGNTEFIEREAGIWEKGNVSFLGRLERRKGVVEWIRAAVKVAAEQEGACFEFIGANVLGTPEFTGEELLERLVPPELRLRFQFRGSRPRSSLPRFLARARIVAVPSRWENFPYTCVEAMASGVPVIATRQGGMAEMIADGRTGWLTGKSEEEGLAETLRRALAVPPAVLAEMGRRAADEIRRFCANDTAVERHMEVHERLARRGAKRSFPLPGRPGEAAQPVGPPATGRGSVPAWRMAVVIEGRTGDQLAHSLQSIAGQTERPEAVVVVDDSPETGRTRAAADQAERIGARVIRPSHGDRSDGQCGLDALPGSSAEYLGIVWLRGGDALEPDFLAACASVLRRFPKVGLVSCWVRDTVSGRLWIRPAPVFPDQWIANQAAPFSAVRGEAVGQAGGLFAGLGSGMQEWDLFNAVLASGWSAVTLPAALGSHAFTEPDPPFYFQTRMRRHLLERFSKHIASDALEIILLGESAWREELWKARRGPANVPEKSPPWKREMKRWIPPVALHCLHRVKSRIRG